MADPWDSGNRGYSHNVTETSNGFYKCKRCGKMATAEGKLSKTRCNPDD